ncbi:MAG: recombinase family protein [Flavobacteriia bacterium]|nr:recombinase family protein [Flavobacteriia bacterium]
MKKINCILYIRVSTDEQADKGYSQRHQEEILSKYALMKEYNIIAIFKEDHSAKSFIRPEFTKIIGILKKKNHEINLLLFTKWDRFSRNAGDAYAMINKLNKFGVEPQAMEQPLDLSVPENKMMLAFYLAAPEVENDRRSLNVLVGMRRAKKEGRYVGSAPKGYSNKRDEQGRAIIVPNDQADHIRKAFEWLATGLYSNIEVKKMIEAKFEHYMSISHFHTLIRNPIYIGYVPIKAYKDEKAHLVKGIHEPLIDEALFWKVQDLLAKKAKILPPKQAKIREDFPLRAILQCRKCGGSITGSRSKGNGGLYSYYHCQHQCRERFKTESANVAFEKLLESFKFKEEVIDGYAEILIIELKAQQKNGNTRVIQIEKEISQFKERISKALQLMLDGDISPDDYKTIKSNYEEKITDLNRKKIISSTSEMTLIQQLEFGYGKLKNLLNYYQSVDINTKQAIISSIFKDKITYENGQYRTPVFNEVINLILKNDKGLGKKNKKTSGDNPPMSSQVPTTGFEPAHH